MYDSYLETTGGFWGLSAATEGGKYGSLHVQLGNWTENLSIVIINRRYFEVNNFENYVDENKISFHLNVQWFHLNGTLVNNHDTIIDGDKLMGKSVYLVQDLLGKFKFPGDATKCCTTLYLRMKLNIESKSLRIDSNNNDRRSISSQTLASFNDYWISNPAMVQSYTDLDNIRNDKKNLVHLQVSCIGTVQDDNSFNIMVTNPKNSIALAIRLRVVLQNEEDTLKLPYVYSKQYFTLLPNESNAIVVTKRGMTTSNQNDYQIEVEGWNVVKHVYACET
jgi:hypothetical protein